MSDRIQPGIETNTQRHLLNMGYGSIHNYIVPGLISTLIAEDPHASAKVRLFRNTRTQDQPITPHSHRFDLACCVIEGSVENTIFANWQGATIPSVYDDLFMVSKLTYNGNPGHYEREEIERRPYGRTTKVYQPGQWYFMSHNDIHAIKFSKDAMVLVFEGDTRTDHSVILEPYVDGQTIRTFKVEDWMFKAY